MNSKVNRWIRFAVVAGTASAIAFSATPAHADTTAGQIRAAGTANVVPDSYIVVLKDSVVAQTNVDGKARDLGSRFGGRVGHVYRNAIRGFEVTLPAMAARRLAGDPSVAYVEENGIYGIEGSEISPPSWGLDRIDQRSRPLDYTFSYPVDGSGVKAYIIDTGIRFSHEDFGGRAISGVDEVDGGLADDLNGHGTHVAGTVGGTKYGVAKGVTLVSVRVLDETGHGPASNIVAGVDWVTADHQSGQPAVANMSLGGSTSSAIDTAVTNSIADGITYGIAAGNDNSDACNVSPARVAGAITVGATTSWDGRWSQSNFGTCLDIFAPGEDIVSDVFTSDTDRGTASGTSMATPHVVGAAAVVLSMYPQLANYPDYVRNYLVLTEATVGALSDVGTGSPNRLLYLNPLIPLDTYPLVDQSTQMNKPFAAQLSATGGYLPYSWSAIGLPAGVTINSTTGLISGTPTTPEVYGIAYTVHDSMGQTSSKAFNWTVTEAETRLFSASATASKPTTALSLAASKAQTSATAAGFGGCEMVDSSVDFVDGRYAASVTLSCIR